MFCGYCPSAVDQEPSWASVASPVETQPDTFPRVAVDHSRVAGRSGQPAALEANGFRQPGA